MQLQQKEWSRDSVMYRKEVIYIPIAAECASLQIAESAMKLLPSGAEYRSVNGRSTVRVRRVRDTVVIDCNCDSVEMEAQYYEEQYRNIVYEQKQKQFTVKRQRSLWWLFLSIGFVCGLLVTYKKKLLKRLIGTAFKWFLNTVQRNGK